MSEDPRTASPLRDDDQRVALAKDVTGSKPDSRTRRRFWAVAIGIIALIAVVYGRTLVHGFVNYDDDVYVTNNPVVNTGLTLHGFTEAFTFLATNWHPLTWLSHMLDVQVFGMHAWGHHLVNVLFHAANALLLFFVLRSMTGAFWRSAVVATLFAVHPLNVESVAWVAQRKTVLSTCCFWLTLAVWLGRLRRPSVARYLGTLACYSLGLMAKPMLVTLPFLLVLLDWWPLGRFKGAGTTVTKTRLAGRLITEKMPLFFLAAVGCILTWRAQLSEFTIVWVAAPLSTRVENAFVSYTAYILQALYPSRLAVLYPYPAAGIPLRRLAGAVVLLAAVSSVCWLYRQKRPYLGAGWGWYLGALTPVIGLVQVGAQSRADRYMYLPLVGILIIGAWFCGELIPKNNAWRQGVFVAGLIAVTALAAIAFLQVSRWRNSVTLNAYSARVTHDNYIVLNNLGAALLSAGRLQEAQVPLQEALRIKPDHVATLINLGMVRHEQQRWLEAVDLYQRALRLDPGNLKANFTIGFPLLALGRSAEALRHFEGVSRVEPDYLNVRMMLKLAHSLAAKAAPIPGNSSPQPLHQ